MLTRQTRLESSEFTVKYGIDVRRRKMIVGISYIDQNSEGDVAFSMQSNFATALHILVNDFTPPQGKRSDEIPIEIMLSSYGGDLYHSLSIFDQITLCPVPINISAFGPIMSGASLIMQAAVRRMMAPNAYMMIHYGWYEEAGENDPWKSAEANRHNQELLRRLENIYMSRAREKITIRRLRSLLRRTKYMNAEETVRLGFADGILELVPSDVREA